MITHLDHVYSHLKDNDLEKTLAKYERAGFIANQTKMRHPNGHLNGFVTLTGTYLEFISIVDEADFSKNADSTERALREDPHPYGIGGFYFCAGSPSSRMDTWTKTFEHVTPNFKREGSEISFGCQKLRWFSKAEHAQIFGNTSWDKHQFLNAEICGVRLLAESLTTAKAYLERGGFQVRMSDELNALITTDPNSAYTLVIEEGDSREFLFLLNGLSSKKID
jgi:hypothetical protein